MSTDTRWPERLRDQDAEVRALIEAIPQSYDDAASDAALERAIAVVDAVATDVLPRRSRRVWPLAAAALLLLGIVAWASRDGADRAPTARLEPLRGRNEVSAGSAWTVVGAPRELALPARVRAGADAGATLVLGGVRVELEQRSELRVEERETGLADGAALHTVRPGEGEYRVGLGRYHVLVRGTQFWTARDRDEATVCVTEGVVEVRRGDQRLATLGAGEAWRSSRRAPPLRHDLPCAHEEVLPRRAPSAPAPPRAVPAPALRAPAPSTTPTPAPAPTRARVPERPAGEPPPVHCAEESDPEPCWERQARGAGLTGEMALYRLGRARAGRGDRSAAMRAWREHRSRFPSGVLAEEVELAMLEVQLEGAASAARATADRFLREHPTSEHAAEVRAIRASLRHAEGDCEAALAEYQLALDGRLTRARREHATFGRAACLDALGRSEAGWAYRAYLAAYPDGRFAARARLALSR